MIDHEDLLKMCQEVVEESGRTKEEVIKVATMALYEYLAHITLEKGKVLPHALLKINDKLGIVVGDARIIEKIYDIGLEGLSVKKNFKFAEE